MRTKFDRIFEWRADSMRLTNLIGVPRVTNLGDSEIDSTGVETVFGLICLAVFDIII